MKYRKFGKTGLTVSEIGFGAWAIGGSWGEQKDEDSVKALNKALDLGVNFIDTAAGYGGGKSERMIAEVLKDRNEQVYICTKTPPVAGNWPPSPYDDVEQRYPEKYLRENVEERLRNLNSSSLDVLLLHTWTRAWNDDPKPLKILGKMKDEGIVKNIGISTPEHDQNSLIQLMKEGWLDVVQVIYNIFEQEPAAQFLPSARDNNVGVIVRVAFDEGVLTGKYSAGDTFPDGDFRQNYFAGDRLGRAVTRVNKMKEEFEYTGLSMPQLALKFALAHEAVGTVIPGIRNEDQAQKNAVVSDLPDLDEATLIKLREHRWNRANWYGGK